MMRVAPSSFRRRAALCAGAVLCALHAWTGLRAESGILDTAVRLYEAGDYHSAVTESMRYQFLYPAGPLFARSLLLAGKAYYRGGDTGRAMNMMFRCHREYPAAGEGEEALYLAGFMQLVRGEPLEAVRIQGLCRAAYPGTRFAERLDRDACFAPALMGDMAGALMEIERYRALHPRGAGSAEVDRLESIVRDERGRPRRHLWVSVLGSIFIPGFGHFYTGHYAAGVLTFLTNAFFGFMIYQSWLRRDTFQMVFFGLAGALIYQYNIYGAVSGVREYNRKRDGNYIRAVRMAITASF